MIPRGAKFKVTSPRKAALLRKTPKKKKSKSPVLSIKSPIVSVMSLLTPNIDVVKQKKVDDKVEIEEEKKEVLEKSEELVEEVPDEQPDTSDLNRSDSVQEVAALLTHLPETILAKTNSSKNLEEKIAIEAEVLLETPLKMDCSMSPLPNTPRFAVPIVTTSTQETPIPKAVKAVTTKAAISSIVKHCDILTPSFPITPGFKDITPIKSDLSPASGYSSRRTDYSSCSSYYKPDESEEITKNIESMIKKARSQNSQSESDTGAMTTVEEEHPMKIRVGSAKKVEVPGAMDRVMSFTEDQNKEIPIPHYTMMEEGLLSESIVTTASDSDSSSSFTCSTCSTDPSTDDNTTMEFLNQSDIPEDDAPDSEWHCEKVDEVAESNNSLIDEKTGELRFPLRNLMTPRKVEEEIKTIIEETAIVETKESEEEVKNRFATNLEAVKQRTLRIIKNESAAGASKKNLTKFRKSNAKAFKVPAEQPRQIPQSRREQILSQNLSNRSRPTPLKLIPSTAASTSSSSRRKNATPRKTIVIDDLPKALSPLKKQRKVKKKSESPVKPSPVKERISLENISDNAVMADEHPSLNISTSFNEENSDVEISLEVQKADDEGSNTFQKAMIEQGFNKKEVEELEKKLVEEEEEPVDEKKEDGQITDSNDESEEEEDDCTLVLSDVLDKNTFKFHESTASKRGKKSYDSLTKFPPSKCNIDGNIIKLGFSEVMELFSMPPASKSSKDAEKINNSKRRDERKNHTKTRSSGGVREETE